MVALADTLKRRDRLDLAEDLHHRAIELQVKVSGKSDLTTLTLKLNLAELLRRRSKVDESNALCTDIRGVMGAWTTLAFDYNNGSWALVIKCHK